MLQGMFNDYPKQIQHGSCLSCHLHRLSSRIHLHTCTDVSGVTPDPLDHSFAWQLLSILQAVDAVALEDDNGCFPSQVSFLQRPVLNQQSETNPPIAFHVKPCANWNSSKQHSKHGSKLPFSSAYTFCCFLHVQPTSP